ncbi:MAG: hypothetical protein K2X03_25260 [Bryobacteraceae bacterium]|nr:hypothetical protein [Bryobacteraceae bacterium]
MKKAAVRFCWLLSCGTCLWPQPAVTTAQYDNARTGANPRESHLTPGRVASGQFGFLFSRAVDGLVYALPLYVPNLEIPNRGRRNVLFVATTTNQVYAFDADRPAEIVPLWSTQLGTPVPITDTWRAPTMGVLSTPVIDSATQTLYCVAMVQTGSVAQPQIFALDLTTGARKFNSPGIFRFPFASGTVLTNVPDAIQRAGLLFSGGRIYTAFANLIEDPQVPLSQEGWVISRSATDLSQDLNRFQVTPTGLKGGIWQAGRGLAADPAGNLFIATAGGLFDGLTNFGASYLKLSPALSISSFFTPSNHDQLFHGNLDPSATGMILIPGTNLVLGGGKTGLLVLLNQGNLGGLETVANPPLQRWDATEGCGFADCAQTLGLAYFSRPGGGQLFVADRRDAVRAYSFDGSQFNSTPASVSTMTSPLAAGLTVSSQNSTAGIVWALMQNAQPGTDPNFQPQPAVLRALNPDNLAQQYWNSDLKIGEAPGDFVKFTSPVVVNGRVYVPTSSNRVAVYGMTCAQAAPDALRVQYSGFRFDRASGRFLQGITVTNAGTEAISGPFYLALTGLPAGTELANRSGVSSCALPASRPVFRLDEPLWLLPGQSTTATLQFTAASTAQIRYTGQLLNGSGGL